MTTTYQSNIEYARSLQQKYEYYLIALNFTLLVLSVQTAKFQDSSFQILLELSGWMVLLIAGLIGLIRLEMQPVGHSGYAELERKKSYLDRLKEGKISGTREVVYRDTDDGPHPIDEVIELTQDTIDRSEEKLTALQGRIVRQYNWHKYLFVSGLV